MPEGVAIFVDPETKDIESIIRRHLIEKEREENRTGSLKEALGLGRRELVSLVGGGGKTSLMFRLAHELASFGKVVTTTTTRILEPSLRDSGCVIVEADERKAGELVRQGLWRHEHITLARERIGSDKLKGVSADLVRDLWKSSAAAYLLVEADGAAGRPLKAPRDWEPVIPGETTLVVAVLGMDALGAVLNEESVFQAGRVSMLTGVPLGREMTEEGIATLVVHPEGLFRGAPESSRVVAFLNKVDLPGRIPAARRLARRILDRRHPRIERVVLGRLKQASPAAEVIFP